MYVCMYILKPGGCWYMDNMRRGWCDHILHGHIPHTCTCTNISIWVCMCMCMCMCVCIYIYIYMHTCMYVCIHIYAYIETRRMLLHG